MNHPELLQYVENRLLDSATKRVVYDSETDGLDWRRNRICGHVLTFSGDPRDSVYLPIRHKAGGNMDPDRVNPMLRAAARARPDLLWVGFNIAFDMKMMANEDIRPVGPLEDGQINSYLIDENQRDFSLGGCCRAAKVQEKKEEDVYAYLAAKFGGKPTQKQMSNFHLLAGDDPVAVDYATGDGTSTWQLRDWQMDRIEREELLDVWRVECRVIRVLHRMTSRGVKIDLERFEQVRRIVARKLEEARSRLPPSFNERAPTQMKKLFTDAGVPESEWPRTEKGNASFPEWWLRKSETGRLVVAARKLANLENSFLNPLANEHLWHGRVHCTYNQTRNETHGTVTGRLSCSDPNLQQVHKRDEILGSLFRSFFAPDDGMLWGSPDYSQIEPRLLAHYGKVKALIEGYLASPPIDAHSSVARAAGIPRQAGKTLNQALITGSGDRHAIEMLLAQTNLDHAAAQKVLRDYFAAMPEIKNWYVMDDGTRVKGGIQKHAANVMQRNGFVKSLLGRRAHLDDPRFAYKTLNRLLQCGNADVLKNAMADVDEYLAADGDRVHLLNNIHDSLDFQYPPELESVYRECLDMMTRDYGPGRKFDLIVPLEVEEDSGANWAEASYGKEKVVKAFASMGADYDDMKMAA